MNQDPSSYFFSSLSPKYTCEEGKEAVCVTSKQPTNMPEKIRRQTKANSIIKPKQTANGKRRIERHESSELFLDSRHRESE